MIELTQSTVRLPYAQKFSRCTNFRGFCGNLFFTKINPLQSDLRPIYHIRCLVESMNIRHYIQHFLLMHYCGSFHACVCYHGMSLLQFLLNILPLTVIKHGCYNLVWRQRPLFCFSTLAQHIRKRACNFHASLSTKIKTHEIAFEPKHKNLSHEI